ncbi:MAG: hypothetical protein MK226_09530 [Saprospiraceae bacterium]|jgi:hypothetical protein|nr:hypothetical protein [Saprospiraceae bacterium]
MKKLSIILFLFLPVCLSAQNQLSGYISQQLGMEKNPLRNPSSLFSENEQVFESEELTPILFQSNTNLYLRWQRKWEKVGFGFKPKLSYLWYPSMTETNLLKVNLQQQLSFKLTRKWTLYQTAFLQKRKRNGADLAEEVFTLPRSYNQKGLSVGLQYEWNKYWLVDWENTILNRQFFTEEDTEIFHNGWKSSLELKGKWRKADVLKKFYARLQYEQRNWERISFFEEEEEEALSITLMVYSRFRTGVSLALNDQLEWNPYLEILNRNSSVNRQDYMNYKLGFALSWDKDEFSIDWKPAVSRRIFASLSPDSSSTINLAYWYWSNSLQVNYQLASNWEVYLLWSQVNRDSNFDLEDARTLRSYQQYYMGIGMKFRF